MQSILRRVLPIGAVLVAIAFAIDVKTDYDHKADFSRYRTYSWLQAKASDSLWEDRITSAVDSQLAAKGWTKVASGGDASAAALGTPRSETARPTFNNGKPARRR